MPRKPVDFNTVREIAMALPFVEEATSERGQAFKVRGKMLTCLASHRSAEPGSLVVRVANKQRAELLASDPDVYYITAHYEDYPSVLVRLGRISRTALRELLGTAWEFVSSSEPLRARKRR
jgi:hypothetical protein